MSIGKYLRPGGIDGGRFFTEPAAVSSRMMSGHFGKERSSMGRLGSWNPLSYGQEALWFLWKLVPRTAAYNIVLPLRIRGSLDVPAFAHALQMLADRHPSLRTELMEEGGKPYQRAIDGHILEIEQVEASDWDDARVDDALLERARHPFDLEESVFLRTTLFRRAADHHVLVIVTHHIISDLWSLIVLMDELRELYAAAREGRKGRVPELPLTSAGYVAQQRAARAEALSKTPPPAIEGATAPWAGELAGV